MICSGESVKLKKYPSYLAFVLLQPKLHFYTINNIWYRQNQNSQILKNIMESE